MFNVNYLLFCFSKHVFILGPSHHVRLSGCALSSTSKYRTPLYDLTIDQNSKWFIFKHFSTSKSVTKL